MDTSLVLLLPSLDQDCFQLTKNIAFTQKQQKKLPQASKQNLIILFTLLGAGFLNVYVSLSWALCFSPLRIRVYVFGAGKVVSSPLIQFDFASLKNPLR